MVQSRGLGARAFYVGTLTRSRARPVPRRWAKPEIPIDASELFKGIPAHLTHSTFGMHRAARWGNFSGEGESRAVDAGLPGR